MLAHAWFERTTITNSSCEVSPTVSVNRNGPCSSTTIGPTATLNSPRPLSGVWIEPESKANGRPDADRTSDLSGRTEFGVDVNQKAHVHVRVNGRADILTVRVIPMTDKMPSGSIATLSASSTNNPTVELAVTISYGHVEVVVSICQHVCGSSEPVSAV